MADAYSELLGATIQYFEGLKSRGVSLVNLSPDTLQTLAAPVRLRDAEVPPGAIDSVKSEPVSIVNGEAKLQAIAELRARVMGCVKCPNLAGTRKNVVFGVGNV